MSQILLVTVEFSQRPIIFALETPKKMTRLANRTTTHGRGFEMCEDAKGNFVAGRERGGHGYGVQLVPTIISQRNLS